MKRFDDVALILFACLLLAKGVLFGAAATKPAKPCDLLLIRSLNLHDMDTVTKCEIVLPFDVILTDRSIRLAGVDALEVSRTRQTVEVTDEEIRRGREGTAKLKALAEGGKWYVRPSGKPSVYGRLEGDLWIQKEGEWISVKDWIVANKYERPDE